MINGIFDNLLFWHWWLFAVFFIILEILTPGAFFMWMGISAGLLGLILLVSPEISWEIQFILFALISIVSFIIGKFWFQRNPIHSEQPSLNQREDDLIGRVFKVEQSIINGSGRVKVGESTWKAKGPDCEIGSSVTVVKVDGTELIVELKT